MKKKQLKLTKRASLALKIRLNDHTWHTNAGRIIMLERCNWKQKGFCICSQIIFLFHDIYRKFLKQPQYIYQALLKTTTNSDPKFHRSLASDLNTLGISYDYKIFQNWKKFLRGLYRFSFTISSMIQFHNRSNKIFGSKIFNFHMQRI